jgi:hypothetical protein
MPEGHFPIFVGPSQLPGWQPGINPSFVRNERK